MNTQRRTILLVELAAILGLLLVLALSLRTLELRDGGPFNLLNYLLSQVRVGAPPAPPAAEPLQGELTGWVRLVFWILTPLAILYAIISPQYRRMVIRTALFIIAFVFITNRLREMMQPAEREGEEMFGQAGLQDAVTAPPAPPAFVTNTPDWFVLAVDVLLALVVVTAIWFLWRRLRPKPEPTPEFLDSAASALRQLEAGGDVRDVVLRCYGEMTTLMAASGRAHRHRAMTPRDFEQHLANLGMRDEHIHRLTRLFERVRYGGDRPDAATQSEAQACLRAIVDAYGPGPQTERRPNVQGAAA